LFGAAVEVLLRLASLVPLRAAQLVGAAAAVGALAVAGAAQLPQVRLRYSPNSLDAFPTLDTRLARLVHPGDRLVVAQNYPSIGTVTGVALYAHDAGLLAAQSRAAPDGPQLLFVRRVLRTSPMRTGPADLDPGPVWVLGNPAGNPVGADPALYWRSRLLRAGCRPTGRPVLRYHGTALQRWQCSAVPTAHAPDRST
jgi:hypothetical protein